ncbi:hypothetical protein LLQ46_09225 [Rouxiella badensis]|uniref:hypothetical protein n=1 Tax=Rouxiella badensis TaxID=1646377 RepID=UPI001B5E82FF|nr:hypothetical protein [Rouxiella badensis]MCC3747024.1 hypothetical protein [Rouxiella badensis]
MAVDFLSPKPQELLNNFNKAIEQDDPKGKITTWVRSEDKVYYTHKAEGWNSKAWFKPSVKNGILTFNIIKPQNANITTVAYAYYHGHLTETFLSHFDNLFTKSISSSMPTPEDKVK